MANSDYIESGTGAFASAIALDVSLGRFDSIINYTRFNFATFDGIEVGMVAMVDEEIMGITAVGDSSITVSRGTADTIPALHAKDSIVWIFDVGSVGGDQVERSAGETVAVKVSPYTVGGGGVPIETVEPLAVDFNWRFFRPYPPGRFQINGEPWSTLTTLTAAMAALHLTWVHRDRVLQGDKLVDHSAASIGPEPGTTYTMSVMHPVTGNIVRTEVGIIGNEFYYRRAQALVDLGQLTAGQRPKIIFTSARDNFEAWQVYEAPFILSPGSIEYTPVMSFAQRVIESPYAFNVARGVAAYAGRFGVAMGARPVDRMADFYELFADGTLKNGTPRFTPWVTSDFRLPELETVINIRTSSLFDGVPVTNVRPGDIGLIDDEIIQVATVGPAQITVRRGCCDTVPRTHIAGSRVWFFGTTFAFDPTQRAVGDTVQYKLRPVSYSSTQHSLADLPANNLTFGRRAELPYPPGRVVVNGRPWFEEAQAISGTATTFTWVHRNRVGQGAGIVAHEDADHGPENGQVTRLRFYYETPSTTPGAPAVENVLRQQDVAGLSFSYTYAMAQADGLAAGQALGICGTVVIRCRVMAARDGLESLQSYITPVRVPSFPC